MRLLRATKSHSAVAPVSGSATGILTSGENQIALRMTGAGQHIAVGDFGVGQRHGAGDAVLPETTLVLQQPQTPARQATVTGTLLLSSASSSVVPTGA